MTLITAINVVVARMIPSNVKKLRNLLERKEATATLAASAKLAPDCILGSDEDPPAFVPAGTPVPRIFMVTRRFVPASQTNANAPGSSHIALGDVVRAKPKLVVTMPAYNAARTLHKTYAELPHNLVDEVILVDDGSRDETTRIARELGLTLFVHNRNYGYGANQKTCYREALKAGADVVVMVHPDYQYDPTLLPEIVRPIQEGRADVVLGSRLLGGDPMKQGMPWWKYVSNRFLTALENWTFGLNLAEYHTGYRAYRAEALDAVNYQMNSDRFIFDQEIIAQFVCENLRIAEVPVPTRYFPQASSASFWQSSLYGLSILLVLARYILHRTGVWKRRQFESLHRRYQPEATLNHSVDASH